MVVERKFDWDGERIKETVPTEEKKHTPKDIIEALDNVRGKIAQMTATGEQLKQQIVANDKNIESADKFEKELKVFEEKCIELQKKSLDLIIRQIHEESVKQAKEDADKTIAKDPDAYIEDQAKAMPYLNYQKLLATNEKTAKKICARIIKLYLYEEPIFDNPFKG